VPYSVLCSPYSPELNFLERRKAEVQLPRIRLPRIL
jgi:hypothetical protein